MLDRLRFLPVRWLIPLLSFPRSGNGVYKPLDSSLRWNDEGVGMVFLPSDSPFGIPDKSLTSASTVIPAQAGIQGAEPGC